jgi:hypothetical protein
LGCNYFGAKKSLRFLKGPLDCIFYMAIYGNYDMF